MRFISVEQSTDTQGVCFLFLSENIPFPTIIEYKSPLYVFPGQWQRERALITHHYSSPDKEKKSTL